jgi:tetratricopeptide (TPR) repeat protein
MSECKNVPLIEFVRAELDGPQTEAVLAHLDACPACRERVQVMAALAATAPAKRERRFDRRLWLLAAGILVALLIPVFYSQMKSHAPLEELATNEAYPAPFALLTRDGPTPSPLEEQRRKADQAYSRRDYQAAQTLFAQLPPSAETLFYLGVSQYFLDHNQQAAVNLGRAAELDSHWQGPALWYQASAYLKLNRAQEARESLKKLTNRQDEYAEKAHALLAQLDSR